MSVQVTPPAISLSFNFGMTAFEATIVTNFKSIESMLLNQQAQVSRLSAVLKTFQNNLGQKSNMPQEKQSKDGLSLPQNKSGGVEDSSIIHEHSSKNIEESAKVLPKVTQNKQSTIQPPSNASSSQNIQANLPSPPNNDPNQAEISLGVKALSNGLIEQKVFELFERVRQLEEKQSNGQRFNLKKFREFDFQIQETTQLGDKNRKAMEDFDDTVETLRNQISEYKLKKESKIMKALNSSAMSLNQTSTGENYDYMAQKLQFLLKHISQMLTKKSFQEQRQTLHISIDSLRRKMNENINETFFQESLKALQGRIYQSVAKHLKAMQYSPSEKSDKSDQLDNLIEEGNREFTQRVSEHEKKINVIAEDLLLLKAAIESSRKERTQFQEECSDQLKLNHQKCNVLELNLDDLHKHIQEVKQSFQQKHLQSENQIIQLQEALDKVTSNFKSLAFTHSNRDTPMKTAYPLNDNPQSQLLLEKSNSNNSNAQLENDLKSQQKKFNKLMGKVQGLKEDILNFRQDLMREIDGVKAGLEKKADWQSLRKGLNFFQQKLKETKAVTQAIYESTSKQDNDSLAVKKGWTCLVCDKDIKSYQGKLSELKFTSMFPIRESPRIGGYYKQQQASQEYRQVFMSNSNSTLNNRSRRIASLKSKESKEELH